ncbi:MAG: glycyl-radical enzyme activating protein [Candidatus Mcinerneyibacterium aminivorans]|uniref:Glycyl-radical enzyme activating protein n=1 Tax=Candidatus Mcinerneyibacterium aminivorans TaxID=2703815 RepID=A0A5D0M942_9BACT|nr:MAG: glycyl-radical enzyme activating protein [Candidatus Mcinerneyibacterium aminivorans]
MAVIFDIKQFGIHDGPGIRTTVFLKGCPLNCIWCHNPESQSENIEIMYYQNRCNLCERCVNNCPKKALKIKDKQIVRDEDMCVLCGVCVESCYNKALEIVGFKKDMDYILKEIKKDIMFYEESGGGVTFSGGEPLMQPEFLHDILKSCKKIHINTAVDTSGYTDFSNFEEIADLTDLFLYDLKVIDDDKHKKYTGVSNKIILDNLEKLGQIHENIIVRIPVLPGINTAENDLKDFYAVLRDTGVKEINLLPYHKIGKDKFKRLKKEYRADFLEEPDDELNNKIKEYFEDRDFEVKIGG